jgi:hypothetical protein
MKNTMTDLETTMDEAKLSKLDSLAQSLNSKTDQLNASIERLQKRLGAMKIGLEVWAGVPLGEEPPFVRKNDADEPLDPENWWASYSINLGYAKFNDEWQIVTRRELSVYSPNAYDGNWERYIEVGPVRPLTSAPRAIRIEAIPHLDGLVDELIKKAKSSVEAIDDAASKF